MRLRFSGARLRAERKAAGLSPEDVAVRIRRSVAVVQAAETGKHEPGVEKAAALAAAVGVRVDDLLELVDDEQEAPNTNSAHNNDGAGTDTDPVQVQAKPRRDPTLTP